MAKKVLTGASVQEKVERLSADDRGQRIEPGFGIRDPEIELDRMEKIAAVCRYFCQGHTVREIQDLMQGTFGRMRREEPYTLLSYAASRGWLEFRAPHHLEYAQTLRDRYSWLKDVDVVRTPMIEDVAQRAARMLLRIVKQKTAQKERQNSKEPGVIRIGFSGGVALSHLASAFADLLCRPSAGLPQTIVFHSIVAGLSPTDPSTDPNALFTYFNHRPLMQVDVEFLGLHAPAIVRTEDLDKFLQQHEIRLASRWAKELDIIVTSGSDWSDDDSLLARQMRKWDQPGFDELKSLGVEGDVMWRPLGRNGPIVDHTELRALTMKELGALRDFIDKKNGEVLLMMGPCAGCDRHKGRITKIILDLPESIISHLVVDSRSASHMVREIRGR
jgi:DNA-binding transcriptional regulator LsrR (DeoR family)